MKIYIPHIHYFVFIKDVKKSKGEIKEFLKNNVACREIVDNNSSIIWIKFPIKNNVGSLAHEIIHVLQHISFVRGIDFIKEEEHFAYLMQFILNKATGYEFY